MTLTEQAKRFRQLADHIESQPKKQFNQRIFFHSCGTPACIAGHCVVMLAKEQKIRDKCYALLCMMPTIKTAEWLGIDAFDGLFSMFAPWQTQKEAVEELRRRANEIEKGDQK